VWRIEWQIVEPLSGLRPLYQGISSASNLTTAMGKLRMKLEEAMHSYDNLADPTELGPFRLEAMVSLKASPSSSSSEG
jgi:hypothetical protein